MSSSSEIYTGPWVNHSHGDVLGATITLTTRNAAFLLAFLAIIVTTAGHSFWRITTYIVHQSRSSSGPHDAIFYQQQAILKNTGTALDAVWKFSRATFAWRKHAPAKTSRSLSFILMAVVLAAAFAVASIFSSQVTKAASGGFLISSDNCGFWDFNISDSASNAALYASTCYGTNNTNSNASCPFASDTCLLSPTAAYEMDTGPLDSLHDLGINGKGSDRVATRKVATCAPVHVAPYATYYNQTYPDGKIDLTAGLQLGDPGDTGSNVTYTYDLHLQFMTIGYDLQSITTHDSSSGYSGPGALWNPIAAFNRSDADITMFFFAANAVVNTYPNSDPVFGANIAENTTEKLFGEYRIIYLADKAVNAIGCIDQYQICNSNLLGLDGETMRCTPLGPAYSLFEASEQIGLNLYQLATVKTLVFAFRESSMSNSVDGRGPSALQAQNTLFTTIDAYQQEVPLPNNQWQIELSSWFAVSLAALQQSLVQKASGPTDILAAGGYILKPAIKYEEAICKRQMIRNVAGYQNFSTLGIAIILIFGSGLVILGLAIDTIAGLMQRHFLKRDFQRLSWVSDGYLQLQRLVYEGAGYDEWGGCDDEVPVAKEVEQVPVLGGLDLDVEHPRLLKSSTEDTKQTAVLSQDNL
ncbi:hypothetical protein V8E51_007773 [Hyaloscypha variabilis]